MASHSSILAWRNPRTKEVGGLQSIGHKEPDSAEATEDTCVHHHPRLPWGFKHQEICFQCKRSGLDPCIRKIPWRREWLPNLVLWPGEFHGQKSLAGNSQWGHKDLDMIERLSLTSLFHHENKSLAGINAELFIHSAQCLELYWPIVTRYLMRGCRKHSINM